MLIQILGVYTVDVGSIADVLKVHPASIFRVHPEDGGSIYF
jgi:hypothetical protein